MMNMIKMGAFLQSLRKEQGLTQEQLGEKLHVSGKTVSRWETGMYMPPVEMLLALSALYGVSMNELVCGERLSPEALPAKAEENLTAAMKGSASFQPNERATYWRQKWMNERRWTVIVLLVVHGILQIAAAETDQLWLNVVLALLAIGITIFIRNRREGYIEHHLYDEQMDN